VSRNAASGEFTLTLNQIDATKVTPQSSLFSGPKTIRFWAQNYGWVGEVPWSSGITTYTAKWTPPSALSQGIEFRAQVYADAANGYASNQTVPVFYDGGTPTASFSSSSNGLAVTFTDTSTDAGGSLSTHSWTFGDGASSTDANPSHTYTAAGTYSVTETVADSINGTTSSATNAVTVSSITDSAKNIVAASSGLCLNTPNNSPKTGVVQSPCGTTGNLEWTLVPVGSYYHVVAKASGLCLNVPGGSTTAGLQLTQWNCQSSAMYNEQWSLVAVGSNYHIVNRASGLCVNISGNSSSAGAKVIQWNCQSSSQNNDQFAFK